MENSMFSTLKKALIIGAFSGFLVVGLSGCVKRTTVVTTSGYSPGYYSPYYQPYYYRTYYRPYYYKRSYYRYRYW